MIWDWNKTVPAPLEKSVHEMIEDWARIQPDAPAICAWDGDLAYGQLDGLATQLAGRLVDFGIGPGVLVPLCFEKSMWTTVAVLAVLKAGGGFVLLDASLPKERLQAIVRQVKATLVVSSRSNQMLCSQLTQKVVTIDPDSFKSQAVTRLPKVSPSAVMYVVFTSGSTGTPKGVVITHRSLASALYHQAHDHGVTATSRVLDFASYSFDASIINLFMALAAGGCLCVPSDEGRKNDLTGCIQSLRANVAHLTPSVAQFVAPDEVPELHTIILAGEAVHAGDVKRWWGKVNIFNIYGPSECTPFSTINHLRIHPGRCHPHRERFRPGYLGCRSSEPRSSSPLGCVGELLLEGPLVGLGYLNDPEKDCSGIYRGSSLVVTRRGESSRATRATLQDRRPRPV